MSENITLNHQRTKLYYPLPTLPVNGEDQRSHPHPASPLKGEGKKSYGKENGRSLPINGEEKDTKESGVKKYMSIEELAGYLGVSTWLIYKYVKNREIPFVHFGRILRFERFSVDRWVERRMVKPR
ncbi:helix-turn-helix domain-containing protein [Elusimicrobiota bacterium]